MRKKLTILYFIPEGGTEWQLWGAVEQDREEWLRKWTGQEQIEKDIKIFFSKVTEWVIDEIEWEE